MTRATTSGNPVETRVEEIRTGPSGPHIAAFFDFDGTIVEGITPVRPALPRLLGRDAAVPLLPGLTGRKDAAHRRRLERLISHTWRDRPVADFDEAQERLYDRIAGNLYPEAWELIRAHQHMGHTVVLTTSATRVQTHLIAAELGIDHVLCTEPVVSAGKFTGEIDGEIVWGEHKADLVAKFAIAHDLDLGTSFAYSNGRADIPMLRLTGHPTAVNPDSGLTYAATETGWRILRCRRRRPGPYRIGRTLVGLFALLGAAGAVFLSSPIGDRRAAIDRLYRWAPAAALRCAGLRIRITNAEKLRTPRPAVFVFNHQSRIDALLIPYLLRGSFTPVVTAKARRYPIFGLLLSYGGSLFIDRSTPRGARQALDSLVTALREGRSVAIAPEGRVSSTPRLQEFKKGAFHLATQAGVPIVPIVIRNAGQALWRKSIVVQPGTIDIVVLDPIDTSSWAPATLGREIAAIHRLYGETLAHWPGGRTATSR
jgi:putative phosphoserine phosphatase / 1-acylglycerol-3-phosphate O-acyltransferase